MLGVKVTIPIACFRRGMARQYLETDIIPSPSTCYGFLLSLVGETERERHVKSRISVVLLTHPVRNTVLRNIWRIKSTKQPQGFDKNKTVDYQELLTDVRLIIWLDSSEENKTEGSTLEERVKVALNPKRRSEIDRFGGLSLGESTHLVDEVCLYDPNSTKLTEEERESAQIMQADPEGLQTWTVWVDHVGSSGTRYVTGNLVPWDLQPPEQDKMPMIHD